MIEGTSRFGSHIDPSAPPVFPARNACEQPAHRSAPTLRSWLAGFPPDTLFMVAVLEQYTCPLRRKTEHRIERHRQVSALGVLQLVDRHGHHVQRVEPERVVADVWDAAIERFGTCE